tara:strand:- start:366 stop:728 length:363 start_codon:yes stop_codon:yes gene_type:complete
MYSKQEQEQTVIMNAILQPRLVTNKEIKHHLVASGTINPTQEPLNNYIRACVNSLNRRFKKFGVESFADRKGTDAWLVSKEAYHFANDNLLELIYDEDGNDVGKFFQHPIAIETERLELI